MKSPHPFVLWCRQRTGSVSLFYAIALPHGGPIAENEPFDCREGRIRQFSVVSSAQPAERDTALRKIADHAWLIKHCYENASDEFNRALAVITTRAGYRHIHLDRRDKVAHLISKAVAERYDAWWANDQTAALYARWLAAGNQLVPLDVQGLKSWLRNAEAKWQRLRIPLAALEIASEDLFRTPGSALLRIGAFLDLPPCARDRMSKELGRTQNTRSVWPLIPNVDDLRKALA